MVRRLVFTTPVLIISIGLAVFSGAAEPATELLCTPEKSWSCNGVGECHIHPRPETLNVWRIDIPRSRYAICRRDGRECTDWVSFASKNDSAFLVLHDSSWHPETFKIDRQSGKFAAVRLSGGFEEFDFSTKPATKRPDVKELSIEQRTGTCVQVKP